MSAFFLQSHKGYPKFIIPAEQDSSIYYKYKNMDSRLRGNDILFFVILFKNNLSVENQKGESL